MSVRRCWVGLGVAVALLAVPSVTFASRPAGGRWNGSIDGRKEPLHFDLTRHGILKFTVPTLACTSYTGYQLETFYVPRAVIHGRSFKGRFHPAKGVTVEVRGTFTSAKSASGTVHEKYPCNPGDPKWHANLGRFKRPHPRKRTAT